MPMVMPKPKDLRGEPWFQRLPTWVQSVAQSVLPLGAEEQLMSMGMGPLGMARPGAHRGGSALARAAMQRVNPAAAALFQQPVPAHLRETMARAAGAVKHGILQVTPEEKAKAAMVRGAINTLKRMGIIPP